MNTDNSTPETITIQLTQGQQTIISAIDADLAELPWCAKFSPHHAGGKFMAMRNLPKQADGKHRTTTIHRDILERVLGRPLVKGEQVDHVSGDTLLNTRENLRLATARQNAYNRGLRGDSQTGYKGVGYNAKSGKWMAYIRVDKKQRHLGYFTTPEAAYQAYCTAAKELHGEFYNPG